MCVCKPWKIKSPCEWISVFPWFLQCDLTDCEKWFAGSCRTTRSKELTVSAGGGLRNAEGWQESRLQNLQSVVTWVDFSSSVLRAFEKQDQQSWAIFLVAAVQKHSFVCSRAIFLTRFPLCKRTANAVQFGCRELCDSFSKYRTQRKIVFLLCYSFLLYVSIVSDFNREISQVA